MTRFLLIGSALLALTACDNSRPPEPKLASGMSEGEAKFNARLQIEHRALDTKSVRLGPSTVSDRSGATAVCGTFRAKNQLGGYGPETHYVSLKTILLTNRDMTSARFRKMWAASCD